MRCSSVTSTSRIGVSRSPGVMLKRGTARISAWRYACQDRKSTRLNSSHSQISYAVFCLKKKTSELQSQSNLVCRLLLEKKKNLLDAYDECLMPSSSTRSRQQLHTTYAYLPPHLSLIAA